MFLRKRLRGTLRAVCVFLIMAGVLAAFVFSVGFAGGSASQQGLAIAETAIRRASVQCYALEGVYPPSYDYLRTNYGVQVSEQLYFVDYRFVADNLMPVIAVLPRSDSLDEVMK